MKAPIDNSKQEDMAIVNKTLLMDTEIWIF